MGVEVDAIATLSFSCELLKLDEPTTDPSRRIKFDSCTILHKLADLPSERRT